MGVRGNSGPQAHRPAWSSPAVVAGGTAVLGTASALGLTVALKHVDATGRSKAAASLASDLMMYGRTSAFVGAVGVGMGAGMLLDPDTTGSGRALMVGGAALLAVGAGSTIAHHGYSILFRTDGRFSPLTPSSNIATRYERSGLQPSAIARATMKLLRR